MGIASGIVAPGGTTTTDATAEQWHIKSGLDAYIASGKVTGTGYFPPSMLFDGTSGYYSLTADLNLTSGWTATGKLRWDGGTITSAGGFNRLIMLCTNGTYIKCSVAVVNDQTGDDRAGTLTAYVANSAGAGILTIYSNTVVSDGNEHTFFISYDPSAGTAVMRVDGVDDINTGATGHTITTGTMPSGSGFNAIGTLTGPTRYFDGALGFIGLRGAYLTSWSDFFQTDGTPKPLDEYTWTEWGAQPLLWHEAAKMDEHLGSSSAMTKNGGITLSSAIS